MNAEEFAKKKGWAPIRYQGEWKEYKIYEPYNEYEEGLKIGYPLVVMEKDGKARMSTPDESLEILNYFYTEDDEEDTKTERGVNSMTETNSLLEKICNLLAKNEADKDCKEEAENKCKNEDTDKRKLIDEVAGIMKDAGADDELIRTAIAKMEKIAYDGSEAEKADNEEEEKKEKAKNKAKNEEDDKEEKYEELKKEIAKEVENQKAKNSLDFAKNLFYGEQIKAKTDYRTVKEAIELGKKLY